MPDELRFAASELGAFAKALLVAAGTPEDIAAYVSHHLIDANLTGHDSHGILRVPAYIGAIQRGMLHPAARPTVVHETTTAALIDGQGGFGHYTAWFGLETALRKAAQSGMAGVALRRCGHIGRLGAYVEEAARRGFIAQLTVGSLGPNSGHAPPYGGAQRVLGTNPWAIGIPAGSRPPVVVDFATTTVAEGKLQVARAKGAPLPPGLIVDAQGRPSTNVEDFYSGGMLLTFGGHKGYGLSLVAALLGGLSGARREGSIGGVFLLAIDPAAFGEREAYFEAVAAALATVKAVPPAPGVSEVLLPGEPEERSRIERSRTGIPLPEATWAALVELAQRLQVQPPAPLGPQE